MTQQHASGCWWLHEYKKLDQEWQAASARAQQHLMKIADSIQKTTYLEGEHWGLLGDCANLHERASSRGDIFAQMSALLCKYDEIAGSTGRKLDEKTRRRYESFLLEILAMYEQELVAKSLIAADIFECRKHDTMTIYIASWQMQPHIDRLRLDELDKLVQNDAHYH